MPIETMGYSQQNTECRELPGASDPVPATSKLQGKGGQELQSAVAGSCLDSVSQKNSQGDRKTQQISYFIRRTFKQVW